MSVHANIYCICIHAAMESMKYEIWV